MTWRPTPYPAGTTDEKIAALRKHSSAIAGSGMTEKQAMETYRESDVSSIAIIKDWFIFQNDFDPFEWPPVADYSIVKPFKLFTGHVLADRKCRDIGSTYVTTYMQYFESNSVFVTVNSTYLLVGQGGMVTDYNAVLREPNPLGKDLFV